MRKRKRTFGHGRQVLASALLCFPLLAPVLPARADVRLYEVSVPLEGPTAEDRTAAMAEALRAAAVQASGRREAAASPVVNSADPVRYAQRYATTADKMLRVGFDGRSIEQLLQQAGLPLWPLERPVTVVAAPVPDVAAMESAAQWRGLPIEWGGAVASSEGSSARALLTGVPSGSEFTWTFTYEGRSTQLRGSPQDGIDLAADTLAARYATASTRSINTLTLRVGGMDALENYAGLLAYLRGLSLVHEVNVDSLDGAVLTLTVTARGDRELLGQVAAIDGRMRSVPPSQDGAGPAVDFVYQP